MNCEHCGNPLPVGKNICVFCGQETSREAQQAQQEEIARQVQREELQAQQMQPRAKVKQQRENIVLGTVGALIGALIGAAVIILIGRIGFIAAISGVILAFCTIKGYSLLGGVISKPGFIICLILMIVTPYMADRIDWAFMIMEAFEEYDITLKEAFAIVPDLIKEGAIEKSKYILNLVMLYVFTAVGAVSKLRDLF